VKNNDYRSPIIALCLALFASLTAFAQPEKIALKMVPEPNQTVRMKMIQDMELDVSFESETPLKMLAKTVFALTQKVGAPDKDGNITSELTYDEVSSEMTLNGQSIQLGDAAGKFIGQTILATFNKQGEIIDFKIPTNLELSEELLKKTLKSLYGDLPQTAIGVGEIATAPLDFTIALPVPGAPPLKIEGQINSKLVSIDKNATGRIAKLTQTVGGKMVSDMDVPRPNGQINKISVDFSINGGGDMMMDVDRGVLRSSDVKMTFGGSLKMIDESGEKKSSTINMQGTVKTTVTGGELTDPSRQRSIQ
jgi:hypothetical protein